MAQITVNVCDECLDPSRPATEWVVTRPSTEEWWKVWLCPEHGAGLERLVSSSEKGPQRAVAKKTAKKATKRPQTGRGRKPMSVVTPAQLAALKAKGEA